VKNFYFFLVIISAAVLQAAVMDYFRFFRVAPDLLLICVVLVSLYTEWRWALALSLLCGVLKDSLGVNTVGMYTVLFTSIGFITLKLSRALTLDNGIFGALFTFVVAFVCDLCVRIVLGILGTVVSWGVLLRISVLDPVYTAVFFLLACRLLKPLLHPVSLRSYR
jgi:rod shape-determining protein MreD